MKREVPKVTQGAKLNTRVSQFKNTTSYKSREDYKRKSLYKTEINDGSKMLLVFTLHPKTAGQVLFNFGKQMDSNIGPFLYQNSTLEE